MKLLVINPNTSVGMTNAIKKSIDRIKNKNYEVIVTCADFGPKSLESYYDYSLATIGSISEMNKYENVDGALIACFGDPGLYSIKEKYNYTTIGIAEAALSASLLIGKKFSLLVASEKAVPMMDDMVNQYGLGNRLSSIETIGLNVLQLEEDRDESIKKLESVGRIAIEKGAEVLVLACAGMTDLRDDLERVLNIPIVDPVVVGYKMLESLLEVNLKISKIGLYKEPYPKEILNKHYIDMKIT